MRLSLPLYIATTTLGLVSASSTFLPKSGIQINGKNNLNSILTLRGGVVFEDLTTLQNVEDKIMKASAQGKSVVIDFSATWCGPCKMISPLYHEFSDMDEFSNTVFLKIDVDQNPQTAAKYNVKAMPTFVFIKRGQVVNQLAGASPDMLKEMLKEIS